YFGWQTPQGWVQGYRVERAPDDGGVPGAWTWIGNTDWWLTSWRDYTVVTNHTYWYRVAAYNWIGGSSNSTPFYIVYAVPPAPPNFQAVNNWRNEVTLTWETPEGPIGVDGFQLQRAPDNTGAPGAWTTIATVGTQVHRW